MPTREILRENWLEFFQTFTIEHTGWLVNVGIKGRQPDYDAEDTEVRQLPLREITADLKDHENTVVITVGLAGHHVMRHSMQTVAHVRVTQSDAGVDTALQIESMDGGTTTVKFKAPAPLHTPSTTP